MTWRAIARSTIGTSHHKLQMPCQDYGNYCIFNDVIIGAVADGAGSAKYAEVGAKLAVEAALSELKTQIGGTYCHTHLLPSLNSAQAREIFSEVVKATITALRKKATAEGHAFNDFACTLLLFVATTEGIAAMQIGDGFIVVGSQTDYHLLFRPDKGEFINETVFITTANVLSAMQVCVQPGHHSFICAATDGLEKVAIRLRDWTPFAPFFQPLETYLRSTPDPEHSDGYIADFLNSDRLNARTDDDKTLLLCLLD